MLVTKKNIAIAIQAFLAKTTVQFDFTPHLCVSRGSSELIVDEYLKVAARILGHKKNWIVVNEVGEKVKFVKKGRVSYSKEKYIDGDVYQSWTAEIESDNQIVIAYTEWNDTSFSISSCSYVCIKSKELKDGN